MQNDSCHVKIKHRNPSVHGPCYPPEQISIPSCLKRVELLKAQMLNSEQEALLFSITSLRHHFPAEFALMI